MTKASQLSRRERQIMDVIYRTEEPTAKDVMENLADAPSYSSVRTLLRKLIEKGHLGYRESGLKYVYFPIVERQAASRTALSGIVRTFFSGSTFLAVNSLLNNSDISDEELERINKLIQEKKISSKHKK